MAIETGQTVPYEFPLPSPELRREWQALVTNAVKAGKLTWLTLDNYTYLLKGECPRCEHSTNMVVSRVIAGADQGLAAFSTAMAEWQRAAMESQSTGATPPPEPISLQVVCRCKANHHGGGAKPSDKPDGCGFGKGLKISIPGAGD